MSLASSELWHTTSYLKRKRRAHKLETQELYSAPAPAAYPLGCGGHGRFSCCRDEAFTTTREHGSGKGGVCLDRWVWGYVFKAVSEACL